MLTAGEINAIENALGPLRDSVDRIGQEITTTPAFLTRGDTMDSLQRLMDSAWALLRDLESRRDAAFESPEYEHEEALRIVEAGNRYAKRSEIVVADVQEAKRTGDYRKIVGGALEDTFRDLWSGAKWGIVLGLAALAVILYAKARR